MNILTLVFAILTILGLFTYTQLEHYKRFSAVKTYYVAYIRESEREEWNDRQEKLYDRHLVKKSDKPNKKKERTSDKGLNLLLILDRSAQDTVEQKQHRFLFKELMKNLFQHTEFYQEIEQKRPHFLDEMVEQLTLAAEEHGQLKKVGEIGTLNLKDDELQHVFFLMLEGITIPRQEEPLQEATAEEEEEEEEEILDEDSVTREGILSLKQFLHLHPKLKKIHVYLAHREMLKVLFGNAEVVDKIIEKRKELFGSHRKKKEWEQASTQFAQFCAPYKKPGIEESILDFRVTGTNPSKY